MLCVLGAAVGLRGAVRGGVRGAGLGQTHASRTGRPILLAPEPSGFGIPERRVAQSAEQEITPAAEGPFDLLLYGAAGFVLARGVAVPLFHFLGKLLDHGTLVADDPVLSNRLLIAVVVVFSISVLTYAFTYAFKVVAPWLLPRPPLLPPPPPVEAKISDGAKSSEAAGPEGQAKNKKKDE